MGLVIPYHVEEVFRFKETDERLGSSGFRVLNRTDYSGKPRYNFFWSQVHGPLDGVCAQTLCDFFESIATSRLVDVSYALRITGRRAINDSITMKGAGLEGKLDGILMQVSCNPLMRFRIDPKSSFRIEKRVSEGESRLYDASLRVDIIEEEAVKENYRIWMRAKLRK